jgi:hypothetical protein
MARVHGKDADYSFNAVAIEGELNNITQNITVPTGEITSFTDAYQNFLAGKKSVTTELSGTLDMVAAAGDDTIFSAIGGGTVTTIFDPTGTSTPEYHCTSVGGLAGSLVASYNISLPVGGAATYSATIQHSGSTTRV